MRFGNFMAPFHPTGQNPTLAIERDLDLIVAMDRLGFRRLADAGLPGHPPVATSRMRRRSCTSRSPIRRRPKARRPSMS